MISLFYSFMLQYITEDNILLNNYILTYALWLLLLIIFFFPLFFNQMVSMGRRRFGTDFQLMFRILKALLFLGFMSVMTVLFVVCGLTISDLFAAILAFLPTGWAILLVSSFLQFIFFLHVLRSFSFYAILSKSCFLGKMSKKLQNLIHLSVNFTILFNIHQKSMKLIYKKLKNWVEELFFMIYFLFLVHFCKFSTFDVLTLRACLVIL